jgi:LPS sulfotransferase NodH
MKTGRAHAQSRYGSNIVTEMFGRIDSYLICATPRTGSSLLCGLLDSAGVAGHPESWFRRQDERAFAARWGIANPADGTFGYPDYFRAAVAAGSSGSPPRASGLSR